MEPIKQQQSVRCEGRLVSEAWKIKRYSIVHGPGACDWPAFEAGIGEILGYLPPSSPPTGSPGVGFLIAHQTAETKYLVLCWWGLNHELDCQVLVQDQIGDGPWRVAVQGESFCASDIEVVVFEREAYQATRLQAHDDDSESEYLLKTMPERIIENDVAAGPKRQE